MCVCVSTCMCVFVFYPPIQGQEDGVTLDVSVDHSLTVKVCQRLQNTLTHCSYLLLIQPEHTHITQHVSPHIREQVNIYSPGLTDDVGKSTSLQVLHDYPEFLLHQSTAVHLDHIPVMVISHDHHLAHTHTQTQADRTDCDRTSDFNHIVLDYFLTSLKSSSRRCCFLRSIIFTATCRPL